MDWQIVLRRPSFNGSTASGSRRARPGSTSTTSAAGIALQVLSALTPGAQNPPGPAGVGCARKLNSWLAEEVVPAHPGRFSAFAALPMSEALDTPVYITPNWPSPQVMDIHYNRLGNEWVSRALGGAGYGWRQEVAPQCLRMIASGVFDRFPKLQIIVGRVGEGLPFFYRRFGGMTSPGSPRTSWRSSCSSASMTTSE